MDTSNCLVRPYEPEKGAVPIPDHFQREALYCADRGIALHDKRNPFDRLRAWALANQNKPIRLDSTDVVAASEDRAYLTYASSGAVDRMRNITIAERNQRKAEVKRWRKLQKQRGVR
jgi:hypothetical protein